MVIKEYTLVNEEKFDRAVNGSMSAEGKLFGGVGENASDEEKLAEYDRLGGLILKGKYKVKTGSFYDFSKRAPRSKPEVIFVFRDLEGDEVEVPEGEEIPLEVKAAEVKKVKKAAKKSKKTIEDEE